MDVKELRRTIILQIPIRSKISFEACCKMNVGSIEYSIIICSYYSTCMLHSMLYSGIMKITERAINIQTHYSLCIHSYYFTSATNQSAGRCRFFFLFLRRQLDDRPTVAATSTAYSRSKDCSTTMYSHRNDAKGS